MPTFTRTHELADSPDDGERRDALLAAVGGADLTRSLDGLLELTYSEPDRNWLQSLLLAYLDAGKDPQLRSLAVTCIGHVARLDGAIRADVDSRLHELVGDPLLGGIAEDALDDVTTYLKRK